MANYRCPISRGRSVVTLHTRVVRRVPPCNFYRVAVAKCVPGEKETSYGYIEAKMYVRPVIDASRAHPRRRDWCESAPPSEAGLLEERDRARILYGILLRFDSPFFAARYAVRSVNVSAVGCCYMQNIISVRQLSIRYAHAVGAEKTGAVWCAKWGPP